MVLLYRDTYLQIDYGAAARGWVASRLPAMMTGLCNRGQWVVSNAEFDLDRVTAHDRPRANAGD